MRRFKDNISLNSNNGGGGGPWGGGDGKGGGKGPWGGGGGGGGPQGPDLDDLLRKGRDQLKIVLGGKGGGGRRGGGGRGGDGPQMDRKLLFVIPIVLAVAWLMQSFYSVKPEEKAVELFFGKYNGTTDPGLHIAPWPFITYEILPVTRENTIDIVIEKLPPDVDEV